MHLTGNKGFARRLKNACIAALTMVGVGVLSSVVPSVSAAEPTNELVVVRLFDGTAGFDKASDADPVVTTALPAEHTPGLDSGPTNDVVRTYDLYAVRAEYSVNEGTSTGLKLTMVLPSHSQWAPDETGMFTGCLDGSTIEDGLANDGVQGTKVILNCLLGDLEQGTHGAVQPIAKMGAAVDSTTFNVTTTLTSDQNQAGITKELPRALTVSEAPRADWSKQAPVVSDVMDLDGGIPGYLYLYPIALRDLGQSATPAKGSGRLADNTTATGAPEIVMYDHMWNLADGARKASSDELKAAGIAGDPCGAYAQSGPFPTVAQGASGTWTCTSEGNSGTTPPYPIEKISVTNYGPLVPAPATNADNSKNGSGYILTGQIVIAVPKKSVDDDLAANKPNPVLYDNAVSATTDDLTSPDVSPITVTGESGQTTTETNAENNNSQNAVSQTGPGGDGGAGGGNFQDQWGAFTDAISVIDYPHSNGAVATAFDDTPVTGAANYWSGTGTVARSQDIGMQLFVGVSSSVSTDEPIHGCMVWDPQQIRLKDMQPSISGYTYENRTITGYFDRPPSNTKYDLLAGSSTGSVRRGSGVRPRIIPWSDAILKNLTIHVEFAKSKSFSPKVAEGEVNCNEDSADTNGWVDGDDDAALTAKFDPDGDGLYDVDMVRVRTEGSVPWYWTMDKTIMEENGLFGTTATAAIAVSLTGAIGTDYLGVNKDDTVVRLHTARANGAWDPATQNAPTTPVCYNWNNSNDYDDKLQPTVGWCSNSYDPAGENSSNQEFTALDAQSFTFGPATQQSADSDIVTIVGARPEVEKDNLSGVFDIKDNGQSVSYRIQPSVVGAPIEALSNVVLTDQIPAGYLFSKILKEPTSDGAFCDWPKEGAVGGTPEALITCRYSEQDPAVDTGPLPPGLPGGWGPESAAIEFSVVISGASARPNSYRPIENVATLATTIAGLWDPTANGGEFKGDPYPDDRNDGSSAFSFLPFANADGAIVKNVDGEDRCTKHPTDNPPPAGWAEQCSLIKLDTDASNLATNTPDDVGNINYSLTYTNGGNTRLSNLTFVDVLPYNGDGANEPGSETPTTGDARTPPSDFTGKLGFIGVEGAVANWVTAADPTTVSRDPVTAVKDTVWCDTVGGTVQNGVGTDADCPATAFDVTAVYVVATESLAPDQTTTITMKLDTERASCNSIWTNTFGARADEITLPIRSNDVSTMVLCTYDMAIQKRVGKNWQPGADWVTYGQSTVTFDIEVINQANPVEDFNLTDYIDTTVFKYLAADNPAGTTTPGTLGAEKTGPGLPYTFVGADGAKNVTIKLDGKLGQGESVILPITLRVIGLKSKLINNVEISYFDNDGDPSTGDSDPANPANANGGPLVDIDSTPDTNPTNDKTIDNAINLTPATGDEDDFDPAEVPWYDLALVKPLAPTQKPTVIFNGETALVKYNITVKNQSLYPVRSVGVLDSPALGFAYDSSNPTGTQTIGGVKVDYGGSGTFNIQALQPGQSVTIPVTYKMTAATAIDGNMTNTAEITTFRDATGKKQPDVDSTPDGNPNNDKWKDPLVDGKKNPDYDANNNNDLHDIAAKKIDEDDHDRVMVNTLYSLGNEVWLDTNNNGKIDPGEQPISEVAVSLYLDADGNGFPDDTNGDRFISVEDAIARDTTDSNGLYLFSNLKPSNYIVGIDASNWDVGGQLASYISSGPTEVDPNADVDNNDNGIDSDIGFVHSGSIKIGPKEPTKEPGPDNDTNADILSNLTIDFGFYRPNFDLALRKRLANASDVVVVGQQVTFNIEVFNQGNITGTDIELVDYLPNELRLDDPDWSGSTDPGARVTYKIPGSLEPGKSIVIPITVRVVSAVATANFAEIAKSTPIENGKILKFPNGVNIPDIDSTADTNNKNDLLVDDVINSSPTGVPPDEDDHDVAYLVPVTPPGPTGADAQGMAQGALALIVIGGALVAVTRRRRAATLS